MFQIPKPMRQAIKIQAVKIINHLEKIPLLHENLSLVINNCLLLYIRILNTRSLLDSIFQSQLLTFFVTFKTENFRFLPRGIAIFPRAR